MGNRIDQRAIKRYVCVYYGDAAAAAAVIDGVVQPLDEPLVGICGGAWLAGYRRTMGRNST